MEDARPTTRQAEDEDGAINHDIGNLWIRRPVRCNRRQPPKIILKLSQRAAPALITQAVFDLKRGKCCGQTRSCSRSKFIRQASGRHHRVGRSMFSHFCALLFWTVLPPIIDVRPYLWKGLSMEQESNLR
jgi:hypothetical protein